MTIRKTVSTSLPIADYNRLLELSTDWGESIAETVRRCIRMANHDSNNESDGDAIRVFDPELANRLHYQVLNF